MRFNIPSKFRPMPVYYKPSGPSNMPLTFTAIDGDATVKLSAANNPPSVSLSTSTDGGRTWSAYSVGTAINIPSGSSVMMSGNNTTLGTNWNVSHTFVMTGKVEANGNIMSLLNFSDSFATGTSYNFARLFFNCSGLIKTPLLPATTLVEGCYYGMFLNCSSLIEPPQLPATTISNGCYSSMFENCYALTAAPDLPATGLTDSCYLQMFNHCSGLVKAPETLPGISLAPYCYKFMFRGANITKAPTIMAISYLNQTQAMNRMFYECSNLSSIEVKFTYWPAGDNSMINWVDGVAANGEFICPSALGTNASITRGTSNCPTNWTVYDVRPEPQPQPQPDADLIWHMDFTSGLYQPYSQITGTNGDSNNFEIQTDNTMGSYLHCTKTGIEDISQAVYWSGSQSYINNYLTGTNDFSVSFWLKAPNWNDYGNNVVLCWKDDDYGTGAMFFADGSDSTKLNSRIETNWWFLTNTNVQSSDWVHWVLVRDSSGARWYRNGVLDSSQDDESGEQSPQEASNVASLDINIGKCNAWECNARFDVTKMRIYNKALTTAEIADLYTNVE